MALVYKKQAVSGRSERKGRMTVTNQASECLRVMESSLGPLWGPNGSY